MCYRPDQLWLVYQLESAKNRPVLHSEANWTATYRQDSTLAAPYGWWRADDDDQAEDEDEESGLTADFAGSREGRAAWFVSNCHASNRRLEYARALSAHYPVDIFGACGELKCSRVSLRTSVYQLHVLTQYLIRENQKTVGTWCQKSTNSTLLLKTATVLTTSLRSSGTL